MIATEKRVSSRWSLRETRLKNTSGSVLVTVVVSMLIIGIVGTTFLNVSFSSARVNLKIVDENIKYYRQEGIKYFLDKYKFEISTAAADEGIEWSEAAENLLRDETDWWEDSEINDDDMNLIQEFGDEIEI